MKGREVERKEKKGRRKREKGPGRGETHGLKKRKREEKRGKWINKEQLHSHLLNK